MPRTHQRNQREPAEAEVQPVATGPSARANGQREESKPGFFDRLRQMPEEEWDRHSVYVYRRWPRISRTDSPHYIDQVRHAIDEQWLLEHHGSGKYSLRLNDKRRTLDSYVAEVHDLNHPPKLKSEELIDCPENDRFFELWPQLKRHPENGEGANGDAVSAAVRELGRIARDKPAVDRALADLYLETAKARDSLVEKLAAKPDAGAADQISTLDKILALVERLQGKERPVDQLALFREMLATVREMQAATVPSANSNPLAQVKELGETIQTLRELFEEHEAITPSGEAPSAWERVAGMFFQSIQPAMAPIGNAIAAKLMAAPSTGLMARPPASALARTVPTTVPGQPSRPPAPAEPTLPEPAGATQAPPASPAAEVGPDAGDPLQLGMLSNLAALAVGALNLGMTGDQFAERVEYRWGGAVYDEITAIPQEELLTKLKSVPSVWNALQVFEAQLPAFLSDFYKWGEEEPEEEQAAEKLSS